MPGLEKRDGSASPPSAPGTRSSSPGTKRSADEITGSGPDAEVESGSAGDNLPSDPVSTDSAHTTDKTGAHTGSDPIYSTPPSMATDTAPSATNDGSKADAVTDSDAVPSIDDQVAKVNCAAAQPLEENQKGYVVSMSWMKKVFARSTNYTDKADESATKGDIGPLDNSDIVLDIDESAVVQDEAGEEFVPLRPDARMGVDFEIVPQEGWDMIMKWYGLADESPVIARYAHKTTSTGDVENIQYELNPPIFTIFKISNPAEGTTPQTLKDKRTPPPRIMATRASNFQQWLRRVKEVTNVDMQHKVRIWTIQTSGIESTSAAGPATSRNVSPKHAPPNAVNLGHCLIVDLNTFLSLPEGQRVLMESLKDQTNNPNYNGKMALDLAGLGEDEKIVVLEESLGGKGAQWVSDASKKDLERHGLTAGSAKVAPLPKSKAKIPVSSNRSLQPKQPARGRRGSWRPLGCTGIRNLGNTCYMAAALQCMQHVEELSHYFLTGTHESELNPSNPLAHNGEIAIQYGRFIQSLYEGRSSVSAHDLKAAIGRYAFEFSNWEQQDSQEFILFLLDGLQEDVNRIMQKPYIEKPDSTDEMVHNKEALRKFAEEHWRIYKARNDSVITDLFAGMYKSTIVCMECDKVSIVFEPFNNLTLQVPSENIWSRRIDYFPLHGVPVILDIDVPKQSTMKAVKEQAAGLMGSDPDFLMLAQIKDSSIYEMISESAFTGDTHIPMANRVALFEVDAMPTDYDADAPVPKKSSSKFEKEVPKYNIPPAFHAPEADRMLIPVMNRAWLRNVGYGQSQVRKLFGPPSFIVVSREEAYDFDSILRKLLTRVDTMTTRDIFNENRQDEAAYEDTATDEDDADSADSKIKASSVEGEDGMVNVSVGEQPSTKQGSATIPHPGWPIPRELRNLFEVKTLLSNGTVPLASSTIGAREFDPMSSRMRRKPSDGQSECETAELSAHSSERKTSDGSDDCQSADSPSDSDSEVYPNITRRGSTQSGRSVSPLVHPGEGILLDWDEEAYDALFGNTRGDVDLPRGSLIWGDSKLEVYMREDVRIARAKREARRKNGVTIYECIEEFKKEEVLSDSNAWYCPRCKDHRLARKKFELWSTPDILIVQLKRFNAFRTTATNIDKTITLVDFPTYGLDLRDDVEAAEKRKPPIYDLFAVDNHSGGFGWGHYTAYAQNFNDRQWYVFNDNMCSGPIKPEFSKNPKSYLLFYRRRSDRPLGGKFLEEITAKSKRAMNGSDPDVDLEEGTADSGEAQWLDGSSRNGSSSALTEAGAVHQADAGGLSAEHSYEEDEMPFAHGSSEDGDIFGNTDAQEGMNNENDYYTGTSDEYRFSHHDSGMWSFQRAPNAHLSSQMTAAPPVSLSDGDDGDSDLFDDAASDRAVGGGDPGAGDPDLGLASLTDGAADSYAPTTPMDTTIENIPPPLDADDSDEMEVVELRV